MTTLLAVVDLKDLGIGAAIGAVLAMLAGGASSSKSDLTLRVLALQVRELQKKLDALLKHQGVEMPPRPASGLSPEVEQLASLPDTKIAAIELYREQNPGLGLREAKLKIEEFYRGSH